MIMQGDPPPGSKIGFKFMSRSLKKPTEMNFSGQFQAYLTCVGLLRMF
jgi:hypothetical protein